MTTIDETPVPSISELANLRQRVAELENLLAEKKQTDQVVLQLGAEMAMVDRVCNIVTSTLDISQVYEQFALELQKLVDFERVYINLVDEAADTFTIAYLYGQDVSDRYIGTVRRLSGSRTQNIVDTRITKIQPNIPADDTYRGGREYVLVGLRSSIAVPLIAKNRVIGTLGLSSRQPDAFGIREQAILERLASQIAPALDNARLYEESLRERERFYIALQNSNITVAHADQELKYNWIHSSQPGFSPERVLGKRDDEIFPSIGCAELVKFKMEVLETGIGGHREISFEFGSGLRTYGINAEPMRDASGNIIGLTTASIDLTERKKVEELRDEHAREQQILAQRLVESGEAERRRIALELHDEIGQILTGVNLTLERSTRAPSAEARANLVSEAQILVSGLISQVRNLSMELRPTMLDDLGLLPTLAWYINRYTEQTNIRVTLHPPSLDRRLPSDVETAAYRISQEALTNIARHAGVDQAEVKLEINEDKLLVHIEDDGFGFNPDEISALDSAGLSGMRERTQILGGPLILKSAPGQGTRLTAELPTAVVR